MSSPSSRRSADDNLLSMAATGYEDRALIHSPANPLLKRIRKLRLRKYREQESAFFVEGIQSVWQAVRNGAEVEMILVAPGLLKSERALRMVRAQQESGTLVRDLSPEAFESIAERENPAGLGAIVRARAAGLADLSVGADALLVALDQVSNPGNVGSVIRSVDAIGGAGVVVIGDATDAYHPAAIKASMGTLFSVPVCTASTAAEVIAWARANGINIYTTSAHASTVHWEADYRLPALVMFGNEGEGLSADVLVAGDAAVTIPMEGTASSLNLAVSVGVLLYEIKRQRARSAAATEKGGSG